MHRGTAGGGGVTRVGNGNLFMAYSHVAHDCDIGNGVIMSNAATLGGHITVEDKAILGGFVAVHQFSRIGRHAFIGGASAVSRDVPPYTMAVGNRAKLVGLNLVGLKRSGLMDTALQSLRQAYEILFQSELNTKEAVARVRQNVAPCPEVQHLLRFVENSERGLVPVDAREKIGLIAGKGQFPLLFAGAAGRRGLEVVAVAHQGETDPALESLARECHWIAVGQLGKPSAPSQRPGSPGW